MKIINENAGEVYINSGKSPRVPYEHQIEAQKKLSEINMKDSFSTLLVLPTGGSCHNSDRVHKHFNIKGFRNFY